MATQIYEIKEFQLQPADDSEEGLVVRVAPLPIKALKQFMATFKQFEDSDAEDKVADIILELATIALKVKNKDLDVSVLEDVLDLPTAVKIVEHAGGVSLDPNQANQVKMA